MSLVKKRQSKTACGYWYGTVFIAFKRTRKCIMTLEGHVAEYLSHKQNTLPQILMSTLFHKRKMIITAVSTFSEGFNDVNFCLNAHLLFREISTKQTAIFHAISMIYQYQESNLTKYLLLRPFPRKLSPRTISVKIRKPDS